jgi:hypothetical protein
MGIREGAIASASGPDAMTGKGRATQYAPFSSLSGNQICAEVELVTRSGSGAVLDGTGAIETSKSASLNVRNRRTPQRPHSFIF